MTPIRPTSTLSDEAVAALLDSLPGWRLEKDGRALAISYKFPHFRQAFAFMTEVALASEVADHHPDWSNSFHKVRISLSTHNLGGLSVLDEGLARIISKAAMRHQGVVQAS